MGIKLGSEAPAHRGESLKGKSRSVMVTGGRCIASQRTRHSVCRRTLRSSLWTWVHRPIAVETPWPRSRTAADGLAPRSTGRTAARRGRHRPAILGVLQTVYAGIDLRYRTTRSSAAGRHCVYPWCPPKCSKANSPSKSAQKLLHLKMLLRKRNARAKHS
jgi:hypothetical protein